MASPWMHSKNAIAAAENAEYAATTEYERQMAIAVGEIGEAMKRIVRVIEDIEHQVK